jgi:very-short-patch-repair endonuclease
MVRGLPATTLRQTFRDLRRKLTRVEYLVLADAALRLGLGRFDELAEPAESPMETRLRWILLEAGLRPQVQIELSAGRADLYYPTARLVIEYDGGNHRDRMVDDNRRQNALIDAGFKILRYTASDVYQKADLIVAQVRKALA